jgi:hypothetical protein
MPLPEYKLAARMQTALEQTLRCDAHHGTEKPFYRTLGPAMARRSLGVVLIVALVSWTVNWLTLGCEGQHSRAAVVVPAGASPAYKPEPSPSRHTCCPQVTAQPAALGSSLVSCCPDCCKLSHNSPGTQPPRFLTGPAFAHSSPDNVPASALFRPAEPLVLASTLAPPGSLLPAFTVLRL